MLRGVMGVVPDFDRHELFKPLLTVYISSHNEYDLGCMNVQLCTGIR